MIVFASDPVRSPASRPTSGTAGARARRRGEPVVVLALIVASWIGARAFAWEGHSADRVELFVANPDPAGAFGIASSGRLSRWPSGEAGARNEAPSSVSLGIATYRGLADRHAPGRLGEQTLAYGLPRRADRVEDGGFGWTLFPGDAAAGLDRAVTDRRSVSPGGNAAPFPIAPIPRGSARRWSGDAWLLARTGTGPALAGGPAPTTYGASQAGAILRYALAPASRFRPAAYARVSSALSGVEEAEAALGLSARPLRTVPVIALGELRATRSAGRLRLRPAVMLVTQVPPLTLPLGLRGELYAQGGYVAGRGATPFADGQFTFDRALTRVAGHQLRVGGGGWAGAQRGAARLDLGPTARVDLKIGDRVFARLALDYRLRVAGNADPGSGPALTASAGF